MSEQLNIKTSGQLSNELAAVNLVSKLMAITLDELKWASKPWSQRSATDQDDTIGRIADGVRAAVRETIEVISSHGFVRVPVQLESLTVKDGIKGVISLARGESNRHALLDSQGMLCTLVLANAAQFVEAPHQHKAEPDQRALPLSDAEHDAKLNQDDADKANADALAAALSAEPPAVTREEIDALYERIVRCRSEARDEGITDDTPEIAALVAERETLVARYIEQEKAAAAAELAAKISDQQALVDGLRADLAAGVGDDLREVQQQLRAEQAALDALLGRVTKPLKLRAGMLARGGM